MVRRFLRKLKTAFPINPAIVILDIYPEKLQFEKIHTYTDAPLCSQLRCLQQPEHGNKLNVQGMDKEDVTCVHTHIHAIE